MTTADLLGTIVDALTASEIPHMLAGSFASTLHGEPRSTHDIDVVIDPDGDALRAFASGLDSQRFYVGDAEQAWRERDQFNVVEAASGWKIDLIIRKDRPFSREEFARRVPVEVLGVRTFVATPEDTILAKLEWARRGQSERQIRDVVGIIRVTGPTLDHDYLDRWAADLGTSEMLSRARHAASHI